MVITTTVGCLFLKATFLFAGFLRSLVYSCMQCFFQPHISDEAPIIILKSPGSTTVFKSLSNMLSIAGVIVNEIFFDSPAFK